MIQEVAQEVRNAQQNYAYQNKVTNQNTISHVLSVAGILLTIAKQILSSFPA